MRAEQPCCLEEAQFPQPAWEEAATCVVHTPLCQLESWRLLVLEPGAVHRESDGNGGPRSVLGAGGNVTQLKLLAQPPHFTDMETKTQQKCGAC